MIHIISIFLGIGILLAVALLFMCMLGIQPKVELFKANSNITNHSPMNFEYLTNPNYARNILATYYLDDDKKINNQRVVNHPYVYTYNKNYGYFWWWPQHSRQIYNSRGIRL